MDVATMPLQSLHLFRVLGRVGKKTRLGFKEIFKRFSGFLKVFKGFKGFFLNF